MKLCNVGLSWENLIADFVQFSRAKAKTFHNLAHFQRSFQSFGIFFGNSYDDDDEEYGW